VTHLVHPADAQRLVCPRCGRTFCSQCGAFRAGRRICSTCAGDDTPRQNRKQMEWAVASLVQLIGLGGIFLWLAIQSLEPTSTSSVVTLDPATGKEIVVMLEPHRDWGGAILLFVMTAFVAACLAWIWRSVRRGMCQARPLPRSRSREVIP